MIYIRSEHEVEFIKESGRIVKIILGELKHLASPGITTEELDKKAEELLKKFESRSAFKGYNGFPGNICTSINEEVVHGIPGRRKIFRGDILSIDAGVEKNGYFADSAITIAIGDSVSENAYNLIKRTEEALCIGIKKAVEGNRLFDISSSIQQYIESFGYSVVRDFVGHGIGTKLHEAPEIPNFGNMGNGPRLKKGMVLAIEPMVNEGGYEVEIGSNGWTAVTKDKKLSAHFEHTVMVTDKEARILT